MISASDVLHLSCTGDLIEGGIAYALHSLPYTYSRGGGPAYERLRRLVAGTAVELAFRRYLSARNIPFEVNGAAPFTEPGRYDVALGGRRCEVKSFLLTHQTPMADLLRAPALVPSDQHAGDENSPRDLYLFAFLPASITAAHSEVRRVVAEKCPYYLVHVMPEAWSRPSAWSPLGRLALKSDSDETQTVEIVGLDEQREIHSHTMQLPPRTRLELPDGFFSVSYIRSHSCTRFGMYSPVRRETYLIEEADWGNIWVYGTQVLLAGFLTREEFRRRAHFLPAGSSVFPYDHTRVKNLAVPVSELRPLAELFERVKVWAQVIAA